MQPPGSEGRRNYETTGVFSPDGEYLPFVAPIVTEGRPEEWLNTVEEAMFAATKKHLYRVLCIPDVLLLTLIAAAEVWPVSAIHVSWGHLFVFDTVV